MVRIKHQTDPIEAFVNEKIEGLRGNFNGERVRELMVSIAHQAVTHFSNTNTRRPNFMLPTRALESLGTVQYDVVDPLDRKRFYGKAPARVIRDFELDFLAKLGDGVEDAEFKRSAGRAMAMVAVQPDADIDRVLVYSLPQHLTAKEATSLTPGDYYLHVAAVSTAYEHAKAYAQQDNYQPAT